MNGSLLQIDHVVPGKIVNVTNDSLLTRRKKGRRLLGARGFVNGDNVKGIDTMRNSVLVNHHHHLGMHRDEVSMRHEELAPVGQLKGERLEAVSEPLLDLVHNHVVKLALP